jgi:hypothetical protein
MRAQASPASSYAKFKNADEHYDRRAPAGNEEILQSLSATLHWWLIAFARVSKSAKNLAVAQKTVAFQVITNGRLSSSTRSAG